MIRPVLKYGASELETESSPITRFDDEIRSLAQDMLETMYAAPGIGLAAPQVGVNLRLIVIDISGGEEQGRQLVLVNPDITEREGSQEGEEGCLSIPGFTAVVERPSRIVVSAQDLDGNPGAWRLMVSWRAFCVTRWITWTEFSIWITSRS